MLTELLPHKITQWQLRANNELSRGSVIVHTKDSIIDFTLESRLASLREKFINGELQQEAIETEGSNDSIKDEIIKDSDATPDEDAKGDY